MALAPLQLYYSRLLFRQDCTLDADWFRRTVVWHRAALVRAKDRTPRLLSAHRHRSRLSQLIWWMQGKETMMAIKTFFKIVKYFQEMSFHQECVFQSVLNLETCLFCKTSFPHSPNLHWGFEEHEEKTFEILWTSQGGGAVCWLVEHTCSLYITYAFFTLLVFWSSRKWSKTRETTMSGGTLSQWLEMTKSNCWGIANKVAKCRALGISWINSWK